MISKIERYRGALVGVLAGDALLAPYETWSAAKVAEDLEKRGGLVPFEYTDPWSKDGRFPPGRPTDDSDQTAALAESLIAHKKLDEEDLFNRLRRIVFEKKSPLWDQPAYGAGGTTRKMLRPLTWAESRAIPTDGDFPSNGSLMRAAPLGLYFGSFDRFDSTLVERMSSVTHRHELALDCCCAYVATLANLLEAHDPEYSIRSHVGFSLADGVSMNAESVPRDPEEWPGRGAAALTLHIAYWSLLTTRDFREGLTKIAALGGDTDTYGAVAGGLLGAYYGIEGIPQEWRDALIGRERMESWADRLFEIAHC
jgi:ADP-ribosyl-[dinitrogen reductase] hydrolase